MCFFISSTILLQRVFCAIRRISIFILGLNLSSFYLKLIKHCFPQPILHSIFSVIYDRTFSLCSSRWWSTFDNAKTFARITLRGSWKVEANAQADYSITTLHIARTCSSTSERTNSKFHRYWKAKWHYNWRIDALLETVAKRINVVTAFCGVYILTQNRS